jgi:hypothetical protein
MLEFVERPLLDKLAATAADNCGVNTSFQTYQERPFLLLADSDYTATDISHGNEETVQASR